MPFENLSGDTLYNVWRGGFQNLLISTLSNSEELLVRQYQAIYSVLEGRKNISYASLTPSLASELAEKLESRTFVIGNILKAGNKIRVNAQLVNAGSEEIYKTYQVDGNTEDDILDMADSLSGMIKNYLEIKKLVEQYDSPAIRGRFTNSSEAYQYYIHGYNAFMDLDLQTATEWFSKAIEIDPDFITAYVTLSFVYRVMGNDKLAKGTIFTYPYINLPEVPFSNDGIGHAKGIDIFWRDRETFDMTDYWLSYSYLDTKRDFINYPTLAMPTFATPHTFSAVVKHWVSSITTSFGLTYTFATGRPYYNPNNPEFLGDRARNYNNLSLNASHLTTIFDNFTVIFFSVDNLIGFKNIYSYNFSTDGTVRRPVLPTSTRAFFLGIFISVGQASPF